MTRKLYHQNQYQRAFSSVVVEATEIDGKPAVILEQTAFYPTSGGQPHDTGTLNGVPVIDVIEDDQQQILHLLAQPLRTGSVEGHINWEQRFEYMQQHTGQHLLSQAFIQICNAETLSFHLGEESSTIDLNTPGIKPETLIAVESLANRIIYENRDVLAHIVTKEELDRFPVRKLPTVDENIRILEIKDFDYSPCGGTHCSKTGEIGVIKITKAENYKGGTRIHFLCGARAVRDYQQKTTVMRQLSEIMSSGESDLPANVQKLQDDAKNLRREYHYLTQQLLEYEAKILAAERERCGEISVLIRIFENRNPKDLKILAAKVLEQSPDTVVLFGAKFEGKASLLFQRSETLSFHIGQLMKTACAIINGRGGGQPQQAQGGGTDTGKLEEALHQARKALIASTSRH
ncbi:truncated alanyl-tRNA synthetase [Candidatus Vecturithrix granuli]|uniref:Alanine--tRNA ligase n=1 Tax=Vecturithrix granuli TaxID=1499967 RepID=A0A081C296_VECG1|nr:truncated alanyl-tRNA synthetase [Candidatus Vecturithrix granuli]